MPDATEPLHNRLALVFDFDDTLAEDSFDAILRNLGLDPEDFQRERIKPLLEAGWEKILARAYCLVELRERDGVGVSMETLAEVGRTVKLFEGVEEMFARVRKCAETIVPDLEVEFYLLSSGFAEVVRASAIAREFKTIWGCEFHADEGGGLSS
jgi:phosphoserine phosphatase